MKLTESLKPSDAADTKPPPGATHRSIDGPVGWTEQEGDRAMRAVAARARDADDACGLMQMLGLIEPTTLRTNPAKGRRR